MRLDYFQYMVVFFGITTLSSCGYNSYDDCILGEMKGQDQSVMNSAMKVCERKHPFEKTIFSSDGDFDITWSHNTFRKIEFTAHATDTEYRITKALIQLTKTECKDLKRIKGMLSGPKYDIDIYVKFGEENIGYYEAEDAYDYKCMKTGTIYGIIDK